MRRMDFGGGWSITAHHNTAKTKDWAHVEDCDRHRPKARLDDIEARLSEIPDDTRNLTQWFFGDPIPDDPRRSV